MRNRHHSKLLDEDDITSNNHTMMKKKKNDGKPTSVTSHTNATKKKKAGGVSLRNSTTNRDNKSSSSESANKKDDDEQPEPQLSRLEVHREGMNMKLSQLKKTLQSHYGVDTTYCLEKSELVNAYVDAVMKGRIDSIDDDDDDTSFPDPELLSIGSNDDPSMIYNGEYVGDDEHACTNNVDGGGQEDFSLFPDYEFAVNEHMKKMQKINSTNNKKETLFTPTASSDGNAKASTMKTPSTGYSTPPSSAKTKSNNNFIEADMVESPTESAVETKLNFVSSGGSNSASNTPQATATADSTKAVVSPTESTATAATEHGDTHEEEDEVAVPIQEGLEHLLAQKTEREGYIFLQGMVLDLMKEVDTLMGGGEEGSDDTDNKKTTERPSQLVQMIKDRDEEISCLRDEKSLLTKDYRVNLFEVLTALQRHTPITKEEAGGEKKKKNGSGGAKDNNNEVIDKNELMKQLSKEYPPAPMGQQATAIQVVVDKLVDRIEHLQNENATLLQSVHELHEKVDDLECMNEARDMKNQALELQFKNINNSRKQMAMKLIGERKPMLADRTNY